MDKACLTEELCRGGWRWEPEPGCMQMQWVVWGHDNGGKDDRDEI